MPKEPSQKTVKETYDESKETSHQNLLDRLTASRDFEKTERKQWKRVIKAIELEREVIVGGDSVAQKIKYPLVFGAYDNYQSSLMSAPPQVVISADDRNDFVKTVYWRGIQDHQRRKLRLDDLKYEFVQSFITAGKSVYKVGRKTGTGMIEQQARDEDGKVLIESQEEVVTENESFVVVVDPRRCWVSPETRYTGPLLGDECPYIIEEMIKTPEYLTEKYGIEEFEPEELETITINEDVDDKDKTKDLFGDSDDFKRVRVYHYFGEYKKEGKFHKNYECLFTNKRKILGTEREIPYAHKKKPYIYLLNHRKFFQAKAMGALDAVMDLDQEYNEHMNRIRTYIRRMVNPKWAKTKGKKIDESALIDPDIGLIVTESEPNSFRPISPPKLDAAIFDKATATEQLFQFLTSITYGKTALKDVGTATGQEIAQQGADVKIARMSRLLERGQEELYTMLLQLEQEFGQDGTDVKILSPDIVEMIRTKKKLFQIQQQAFQSNQAVLQGGNAIDPVTGMPVQPMDAPVDEYANFEVSPDGRTVYATYGPEEIKGEFELYIVSQSSNRNNQAVRSQQVLKAIELSATDLTINRAELWRLWFQLNGESDTDRLINAQPQVNNPLAPEVVPTGGPAPMNPSGQALSNGVRNSANRVI